jgi:CRP-like cAMP-binding protein
MPKRKLINALGSLHPMSKAYQNVLEKEDLYVSRSVKKHTPLLIRGKNVNDLHFILTGYFKLYLVDENNEELIVDFFSEDNFMMIPEGLFDDHPDAEFYIVALKDSELLSLSRDKMDSMMLKFPDARIQVDQIKNLMMRRQLKHLQLLFKPSTERWFFFMTEFKDTYWRVVEMDICRFCGISLRTLIRSKTIARLKLRSRK